MNDHDSSQDSFFNKRPRQGEGIQVDISRDAAANDATDMVIEDSDKESSNGSPSSSSNESNQHEILAHHSQSRVVIDLASNPKPSFLGTDASNPSRQSTLADLGWASKETQQEKEQRWAKEREQMKDERDEAVRCADAKAKVADEQKKAAHRNRQRRYRERKKENKKQSINEVSRLPSDM